MSDSLNTTDVMSLCKGLYCSQKRQTSSWAGQLHESNMRPFMMSWPPAWDCIQSQCALLDECAMHTFKVRTKGSMVGTVHVTMKQRLDNIVHCVTSEGKAAGETPSQRQTAVWTTCQGCRRRTQKLVQLCTMSQPAGHTCIANA